MRSLHFIFATGIVLPYALPTPPAGWLLCNGQALAPGTADHLRAQLIAAGNPYGVSGSNPLLPDLRGEFVRGLDAGRGVDAERTLGSTQRATAMIYDASNGSDMTVDTIRGTPQVISGDAISQANYGGQLIAHTYTTSGVTSTGASVESIVGTRPRNVAMNYIIKT